VEERVEVEGAVAHTRSQQQRRVRLVIGLAVAVTAVLIGLLWLARRDDSLLSRATPVRSAEEFTDYQWQSDEEILLSRYDLDWRRPDGRKGSWLTYTWNIKRGQQTPPVPATTELIHQLARSRNPMHRLWIRPAGKDRWQFGFRPTPSQPALVATVSGNMRSDISNVTLSPDGSRVAVLRTSPHKEAVSAWLARLFLRRSPLGSVTYALWVQNADGSHSRRLGSIRGKVGEVGLRSIQWAPDGRRISFVHGGMLYAVAIDRP
jgi:hypothetical protein